MSTGRKRRKNIKINYFKLTKVFVCEYCGQFAIQEYPNQKYCNINDKPCKYYAELERNEKYRRGKKSKKPLLGSSNLSEHPNKDFEKERQLIQKEKRRYRL